MRVLFLIVGLSLMASPSFAEMPQETTSRFAEALITDRPDAAEASQTVGKNRFQVETSFAYGHDHDAGVTTRNYCFPTLLRFGILGPLEVRLEGEMYSVQTEAGAATQRGISDLAVGLKAHWLDNRGWGPSLGTLAHLSVPTGSNNFSSNAVEPIFKILADWELPADFSLGINAGVDLPARDAVGDKFARFLYAAAVGHPTPFWKERMRIFVEASGAVQLKAAKSAEQTFDTGLALLITPDIQVDGFVQLGLTEASPGLQTGLGFSWRL